MPALLLFLDFDGVLHPTEEPPGETPPCSTAAERSQGASVLLDTLGNRLAHIDIILSSGPTGERGTHEIRRLLPSALGNRISGTIWEQPPPCALNRYEHIEYWLARTHLPWPPSWLALDRSDHGWPEAKRGHLVHCSSPISDPLIRQSLQNALARYSWPDLWWGAGAPPPVADRRRACAVMAAWSVPRHQWPVIFGTHRECFEQRLDLVLTIYAGARRRIADGWFSHWVHLPARELDGRRPIDVMTENGVDGLERVLAWVWDATGMESKQRTASEL